MRITWGGSISAGTSPGIVWSNMPAGTTTWLHQTTATLTQDATQRADLTGRTECRLSFAVMVAGSGATTQLRVQHSPDGTSWTDLVTMSALNATGLKASAWTSISVQAGADVYLRLVGQNGNGNADPRFSPVVLEVR